MTLQLCIKIKVQFKHLELYFVNGVFKYKAMYIYNTVCVGKP